MSRKILWLALIIGLALALPRRSQLQSPTESIRFCEVPALLPGNSPLPNYSPVLCFEYSGLKREQYTLKVFLLEAVTGNFFCASGAYCGDESDPPATFIIDNKDGSRTNGRIVVIQRMDVFDYARFLWVADLYNEAKVKITAATQPAEATANRAPVLGKIGSHCIVANQPLEFSVTATDAENDPLTLSVQNQPPGATFDSGRFRWNAPVAGTYPNILFKASQTSPVPLNDAESITIQIAQRQPFVFSAEAYRAGEGGPAVLVVQRTGSRFGTASVAYATANQTASAGADYTATAGRLEFKDGETEKAILVPLNHDATEESSETFRVTLSEPTACGALGTVTSATVTIVDDDTPVVSGRWGRVMDWPAMPIHANLLPNGKVLFWDRHDDEKGWDGDPRLWDPATNTFSAAPKLPYDIFCGGHAQLADGKLLITGGHVPMPPAPVDSGVGENKAVLYDPFTNTFTPLPEMGEGRWYPSNVTLANGDVLVVAGTTVNTQTLNNLPQVFQIANRSWRNLTGAKKGKFPGFANFYPYLFLTPNGLIFNAGPQRQARWLDTASAGQWRDDDDRYKSSLSYRDYGSSVMYEPGKILIVGGNPYEPDPDTSTILPSATAEVIDLNAAEPRWRSVAPLSVGRRQHNATLLPDGQVLVTGGSSAAGFDTAAGAVRFAELWNPVTETWTTLAGQTRYRGYHSTTLLLPDGRVMVGGGGHPNPMKPPGTSESTEQRNIELFEPPYLFKGPRPTINAAPARVTYGQAFLLGTPEAAGIANVNWVRLGSVTHGFDQNQRINHLRFTQAAGGLQVTAPLNANVCPPGFYMLFILNGNGVPSVARMIQITAEAAPGVVANASAASYRTSPLAVDSIVAAFGNNLSTSTEAAASIPLLTTLAGATVKVRDSAGIERLSPLFFVSPSQVNYLMPSGTSTGVATVTITNSNNQISSGTVPIALAAPGLFSANATGQGVAAAVALRVKANGSQSYEEVAKFDATLNRIVAIPLDLGPETDQLFLILFATGLRHLRSMPTTQIGGLDAEVSFAGSQGDLAGLDQVNVRIPRTLRGRGEVNVSLTAEGQVANTVTIRIQ